jgi:hypothetical protein
MNSKLAKKLRKIAKVLAHNQATETGKEYYGRDYLENERNRKRQIVPKRAEDGSLVLKEDGTPDVQTIDISIGTVTLTEVCVRGIYQRMKKQIKSKEPLATKIAA